MHSTLSLRSFLNVPSRVTYSLLVLQKPGFTHDKGISELDVLSTLHSSTLLTVTILESDSGMYIITFSPFDLFFGSIKTIIPLLPTHSPTPPPQKKKWSLLQHSLWVVLSLTEKKYLLIIYLQIYKCSNTKKQKFTQSELRSGVKVEVAVLGSPSLTVLMVSVNVKQHVTELEHSV